MFDEGNEPEDIFADTEPASMPAGAGQAAPGAPPPGVPGVPSGVTAPPKTAGPSKLLLGVVGLVILGGIGAGAYFIFLKPAETDVPADVAADMAADQAADTEDAGTAELEPADGSEEAPSDEPLVEPEPEEGDETPEPEEPILPPDEQSASLDSDSDGLTDEEERDLGTDPQSPDTDSDGLSDREEVYIYDTDPKNPDTDGDGFLDGEEVRNGYNPNGPGRLFELP